MGLSDTKQPNPMCIKTGPHMFDETCHCNHCVEVRAKRDAGMHIDIETVEREAELCKEASHDHWVRGNYRNEVTDPIMRIPCSVVLALCEAPKRARRVWNIQGLEDDLTEARAANERLRAKVLSLELKPERKVRSPIEHDADDADLVKSPGVFIRPDMTRTIEPLKKGSYICGEVDGVVYSPRVSSMLIDLTVSCDCGNTICGHVDPNAAYVSYHIRCEPCGRTHTVWDQR